MWVNLELLKHAALALSRKRMTKITFKFKCDRRWTILCKLVSCYHFLLWYKRQFFAFVISEWFRQQSTDECFWIEKVVSSFLYLQDSSFFPFLRFSLFLLRRRPPMTNPVLKLFRNPILLQPDSKLRSEHGLVWRVPSHYLEKTNYFVKSELRQQQRRKVWN